MIACSLFVGRFVGIECWLEESSALLETQDRKTLNSWFQIMLRFMHLPTVIFISFSLCAACKMSVTLALFEQYYFQFTQTSQNTECPVSYSVKEKLQSIKYKVNFLFNYIFIKYLFICEKYFFI